MSEIWNIQFLENLLFSVRPCHAPSSPRKSANKKGAPQRRDAPCKSASLIAATQSSYHHYGYNELREKHLLPSNSPIVKRIRRFNCVASSVYHTRTRKGSQSFFEEKSGFGQKPTFSRHLYIFFTFFLHTNQRKKWESGQKARKALCTNGFSLPTFQIKPGKNPLFLARTVSTSLSTRPNISSFRKKVGRSPFFKIKVATIFAHERAPNPILD